MCTMVGLVKGSFSTCLWWPLHLDNWYLSLCIGHGRDSHAVPVLLVKVKYSVYTVADPGFQVGGGGGMHLKKLRRAEGGANIFRVFRVENHDFTPKNLFFSNFRGGGGGRCLDPPLVYDMYVYILYNILYFLWLYNEFNGMYLCVLSLGIPKSKFSKQMIKKYLVTEYLFIT